MARVLPAEVVATDEVAVVHVMIFGSFQFSVFSFQGVGCRGFVTRGT